MIVVYRKFSNVDGVLLKFKVDPIYNTFYIILIKIFLKKIMSFTVLTEKKAG